MRKPTGPQLALLRAVARHGSNVTASRLLYPRSFWQLRDRCRSYGWITEVGIGLTPEGFALCGPTEVEIAEAYAEDAARDAFAVGDRVIRRGELTGGPVGIVKATAGTWARVSFSGMASIFVKADSLAPAPKVDDESARIALQTGQDPRELAAEGRAETMRHLAPEADGVEWNGRTLGQLTPDEKRRAVAFAAGKLQAELEAVAPALGAALSEAEADPSKCPQCPSDGGMCDACQEDEWLANADPEGDEGDVEPHDEITLVEAEPSALPRSSSSDDLDECVDCEGTGYNCLAHRSKPSEPTSDLEGMTADAIYELMGEERNSFRDRVDEIEKIEDTVERALARARINAAWYGRERDCWQAIHRASVDDAAPDWARMGALCARDEAGNEAAHWAERVAHWEIEAEKASPKDLDA